MVTFGALPAQVPIPDHMDLYHLHQEAEPSDRTALQSVVDHIEAEVARLNALEEHIMCEHGPEDERLQVRAAVRAWSVGDAVIVLASAVGWARTEHVAPAGRCPRLSACLPGRLGPLVMEGSAFRSVLCQV